MCDAHSSGAASGCTARRPGGSWLRPAGACCGLAGSTTVPGLVGLPGLVLALAVDLAVTHCAVVKLRLFCILAGYGKLGSGALLNGRTLLFCY